MQSMTDQLSFFPVTSRTLAPYYQDDHVVLYCGDMRDVIPALGISSVDAVITDPPYGQSRLAWDRWPPGWPTLLASLTRNLWCFGNLRMFMDRRDDFDDWQIAQDLVWEKHNGSSSTADQFRRVHEQMVHFYRGEWAAIHKEPQVTHDAYARKVRRKKAPKHWSPIGEHTYESEENGPRQMRSVIYAKSAHSGHGKGGLGVTKPEAVLAPLISYSVPVGGVVLDPFAGSGTTLDTARKHGRRAIGIEIRPEQCAAVVKLLNKSQRELALKPGR